MAHEPPVTSRFRAFTASLGLTSPMSRSSLNHSSSLLRPVSAASLRSLYGNFTLYLRVHSAQNLPAIAQSSYCKLYLGDTPMVGGFGRGKSLLEKQDRKGSSHQTFHTKVQMGTQRGNPEWNEKFQLNVRDPQTEILTIRVKNHVLIYSPAIGACVVQLRQFQLGETMDEWFPLYKNDKPSGQLRLQLCLQQNVETAVPERRYSQPSGEEMQRMIQEHREQQENARRETELLQQEKWKKMEEEEIKHVGLREQKEREDKWKERMEKGEKNREEQPDSDSDLPASFKNRGFKKEEEDLASQLMNELSLSQKQVLNSGVSSGYTVYDNSAEFGDRRMTGFGTIRLSTEELDRVVQNALPTSDSSESMSDQERRRRKLKHREDKKHSRRKSKKKSKRRVYSDESSDTSSSRSRRYRKHSSRSKASEEKVATKTSIPGSGSSQSQLSNQNESRQSWDIPNTLSFPASPSDESSLSSEEDSSRRRRRRRAEKARKREKEWKRRAKRKSAKSRRSYDSSDSSSASSVSSSSSISSSEEERLRRKLKKKKKAKKAKARAILAENGGSRASRRTSGMKQPHKLSYADSRVIDNIPYVAQQSRLNGVASFQANDGGENRPSRPAVGDCAASTVTSTSFVSSTTQQQPLYSSKAPTDYGPDGVSFDEPGQPAMPQYPRQATKEQTSTELVRSFCF